ncbi:MAG: alpha/beta hydrolase [Thermoleophilaceae bacterium]
MAQLKTRSWHSSGSHSPPVVCIHGLAQHGGVFAPLATRLAERGWDVVAVDLRGHGRSCREPPWDVATHVDDLIETVDALGLTHATWVGHSFGGRLIASLAAQRTDLVERLILLEPGLCVSPDQALLRAEIDRLDWSFATVDGAVNAMLSSDVIVAAPPEVVASYVADDVKPGPDGRWRFSFCPSTVVVAWSEMTHAPPPVAPLPTLIVRAESPLTAGSEDDRRYRNELGSRLTIVTVPHGHNVLWESPSETITAVEQFLQDTAGAGWPPATPEHTDLSGTDILL